MSAADWTPEDRRAYESQVLRDVKRGPAGYGLGERYHVESAELKGNFPDTRIALALRDDKSSRTWSYEASIWDEGLTDVTGEPYDPGDVAGDIVLWAVGG